MPRIWPACRPWALSLAGLCLALPARAAASAAPAAPAVPAAPPAPAAPPVPAAPAAAADATAVSPPIPRDPVPPAYPAEAEGEAVVWLELTVGANGTVQQVRLVTGAGAAFDGAALAAASQWRFEPAQRGGEAIASRVRLPVQFTPPPSSAPPTAANAPTPAAAAAAAPDLSDGVQIRGRAPVPVHGASDQVMELGALRAVIAPTDSANLLRLAPGLFVAGNAGAGHAEQIFIRGFNAEHGQAMAFSVGGVPLNEVNNPDGHGYADVHPILPEVVLALHLIEGPFAPQQGDFAVAGSADFELGVAQRGLRFDLNLGSFASRRVLALWAPAHERTATFAAAAIGRTAGFGQRRRSQVASAIAQYEAPLGARGLWRLQLLGYATTYDSPGVVRDDAVRAGTVAFDGTLDPSQGGAAQRFSIAFDLESPWQQAVLRQQVYLIYRNFRLVENFTGRLLDPQEPGQSLHPRRGDAVDKSDHALSLGNRGSVSYQREIRGLSQAITAGYDARLDQTHPSIDRLRFGTQIPYRHVSTYANAIVNLAAYADLSLRPTPWLLLQGGARQESFAYLVHDLCNTAGNVGRDAPLDRACPRLDRNGSREADARRTASASALLPRGSITAQLGGGLALSASAGIGAQSVDASYVGHGQLAPLTELTAYELAAQYARLLAGRWQLQGRAVAFSTHLARDLVFDPMAGRPIQAPGSRRLGGLASLRVNSGWLDHQSSFTYAHASFDDTGGAVPYVPRFVGRSDTAASWILPAAPLWGEAVRLGGTGSLTLLGPRPLPYGQGTASSWQVDLGANAQWSAWRLGLQLLNALDRRYPGAQYVYASDFGTGAAATLVPTRHFVAAAPRTWLLTLSVNLGESA